MEYKFSDRVQTLKPSAIREIFKYAADPSVVSLSAGNPSSYAVLSCWEKEPWARERIDAFRECCREAGASCKVTYFTARNAAECPIAKSAAAQARWSAPTSG